MYALIFCADVYKKRKIVCLFYPISIYLIFIDEKIITRRGELVKALSPDSAGQGSILGLVIFLFFFFICLYINVCLDSLSILGVQNAKTQIHFHF